jgi:hypothetical protein
LTSWATTAKPGPASPTLAASKPPRIANDGRGARRLGEGLRNPLELAGGIERVVDDAADATLELVDKSALVGVAVLGWPRPPARRESGPINEAFQKKLHVMVLPSTALGIGLVRECAKGEKPSKSKEILTHLERAPGRRPALRWPARRATGGQPSTPFRVFTPAPPGQKFDTEGAHTGAL